MSLDRTLDKLSRALPVGLVIISMATGVAPTRSQPIGDPQAGGASTSSPELADDRARGNPLGAIPLNTLTATRGTSDLFTLAPAATSSDCRGALRSTTAGINANRA